MARSKSFELGREPFRHDDTLSIDRDATHGPIHFFLPTQATFSYSGEGQSAPHDSYGTLSHRGHGDEGTQGDDVSRESNIEYRWTARNSRKGRHALVVGERSMAHDVDYAAPEPTSGLLPTLKGIWKMISRFPFDDLSYLTATSFVGGCALLVINAFLSILTQAASKIPSTQEIVMTQACLTFFGCTLFLTSSFFSYLEAVNVNQDGCFGWSAEQTAPAGSNDEDLGLGMTSKLVPDEQCDSHYTHLGDRDKQTKISDMNRSEGPATSSSGGDRTGMRIFPSLQELRTEYVYDLGFLACATLFVSSIIYWSTSLASLVVTIIGTGTAPWIRVLQLLAALGFAVASAIFAIETQDHWTLPAPNVLGWHIGFWNFVGSCGFALFAAFALLTDDLSQRDSSIHYFWGCWGFLIGSVIQWYESLDKHTVERKEDST